MRQSHGFKPHHYPGHTSVISQGLTLTALAVDCEYQWIECNEYLSILNENNNTFEVTESGSYAVVINQNNCIDTSYCFDFTSVGISNTRSMQEVKIFPNPTNGQLFIQYPKSQSSTTEIQLLDYLGHQINGNLIRNKTNATLLLDRLPSGLYFIQIKFPEHTQTYKVLKL